MTIYLTYLLVESHFTHGYNYGLGYIASVLKQSGHKVHYIPIWTSSDITAFYKNIIDDQPDIIAFSSTSSQFPYLKSIIREIKGLSNAFLVCGGAHTTLNPNCITEVPELDAIVVGEGEYAMDELANAIANKEKLNNIKNLWLRINGNIIKNPTRPLIENLNLLPFPDKESLDYQNVIDRSGGKNRFIFSRGCTFKCSYCSNHALSEVYPNKNKYYRYLNPELAIEIIRKDHQKYKFKSIIIDDDTISLNKEWFFKFFDLYKKNFDYPFRCNLRVETVNEEVIKVLKEANAKGVGIGLEHGNEDFRRDVLNRRMSNKEIKRVFELCDKYGVTHNDFIMVGFPDENRKLFFDTVKLAREVGATGQASIFQPYPATDLAKICEDNNWVPDKDTFKERKEAVIDFPNFSKKDIQLCADVFPFLNKHKILPLIDSSPYLKLLLHVSNVFRLVRKVKRKLLFNQV
jgi:radical SAM superfamily enzyme YgiQ (UPF0313 family)